MKKPTAENIIKFFKEKRNVDITHEQATDIIKFLRMLADTVVENYLREQRVFLEEQRSLKASTSLPKGSMYAWDISKILKEKQFSMCKKCTFDSLSAFSRNAISA